MINRELRSQAVAAGVRRFHLKRSGKVTHGDTGSIEYKAWRAMMKRCFNPNHNFYEEYGGRGITVCERWLDYANFLQDMGRKPSPELSLDRENNELGYFPGNCRWVTQKTQIENRRNTVWIEHDGVRLRVEEWSRRTGVKANTIYWRINHGFSAADALRKVRI